MEKVNVNDLKDEKYLSRGSFCNTSSCTYGGKRFTFKQYGNKKIYTDEVLEKLDIMGDNVFENGLYTPRYFVCKKNGVIGHLTDNFDGKIIYYAKDKKFEDKIKLLNDLKQKILLMHKNGIIHGDLHYGNVLFKENKTAIIDFDNCMYHRYKMNEDICFDYVQSFIKKYGVCEELDVALFNFLALGILCGVTNEHYLTQDIYTDNYPSFFSDEAVDISKSLLLDGKKPCRKFLIDEVNKKS